MTNSKNASSAESPGVQGAYGFSDKQASLSSGDTQSHLKTLSVTQSNPRGTGSVAHTVKRLRDLQTLKVHQLRNAIRQRNSRGAHRVGQEVALEILSELAEIHTEMAKQNPQETP